MEIRVPDRETYDFGMGVHRLSGSAMSKVVEGEVSGVPQAQGDIQTFQVSRIKNNSELQQQLGIDVDLSYGCASFGAGVEARVNFMKESKIQSSSLFMTIKANITYESLSIDEPVLTETAGRWMDRPDIFVQRYGDMFVRACKRGGLFIGVLHVQTNSENTASDIELKLKGTYGLFSAEVKGKWKEVLNTYNVSTSYYIHAEGGPIIQVQDPTDPEELLTLANFWLKEMKEKPNENARVIQWTLSPITIAEGPLPPNSLDIEHAQDVLKHCVRKRAELLDQLNLLDWIVSHPGRFDWTNSVSTEEVQEAYNNTQYDLETISDCASEATDHPQDAKMPGPYAAAKGEVYPKAIVPSPLPKPIPGVMEETAEVPDVIGVTPPVAYRIIRDAELKPVEHMIFKNGITVASGIIKTEPEANEEVQKGSVVHCYWEAPDTDYGQCTHPSCH
ncbi:PASTA domain-containing protein [Neobacillus vireti]|uniref:PASTA domain-containing protein n=1 Tax=Neobacillus vireti TaxID=220686 RepID=UPI002FFE254D